MTLLCAADIRKSRLGVIKSHLIFPLSWSAIQAWTPWPYMNHSRPGISRVSQSGISEPPLQCVQCSIMTPDRAHKADSTRSRTSSSPLSTHTTRTHTSRACEHCRKRRTKCSGGIPCDACKKASIEGECQVRTKARPQRSVEVYM